MSVLTTQQIRKRRQIRNFILIWSVLTLIVGICTFLAIYFAYGAFNLSSGRGNVAMRNVAIPPSSASEGVIVPTNTAFPTRQLTQEPTTEPSDTAPVQAVAQAATSAPQPTLLPTEVDRFEVGVQVQIPPDLSPDLMNQWANVAKNQLSVNWVKMQIRWEQVEPEKGNFDWSQTDLYLPAASEQGLHVLASIVTAPAWAREPGVNLEQHGPPADYNDYVNFVTQILQRYPGMIHAVEVWNEHNLDREWTSARGLSAANYVEMLRLSYQAIKNIDPGIIVISGALSPTGLSDGVRAWDDFVYMDQMIQAGLLNYTDCVGVHHNGINVSPDYRWDAIPNDPTARFRGPFDNPHHSWSFRSTLEQYANKIALAGGKQKLCITEFGWASTEGFDESVGFNGTVRQGFEFALDNTLQEQRDFTVAALQNMADWGFVRLAILWNLNYGPQAGWDPQNDNVFYSIIGPGFQFRPVFDAVRDWNREYEAQFN
ncbi:MAG: endo-1,4-beta-xylanase [Anaerolineae bacterium]|nr:endo-1,4-beta-xylanase [Anaerolineae bacterium]